MEGQPNPLYKDGMTLLFWKPLHNQIKGYTKQDPQPVHGLVVPVAVANWEAAQATAKGAHPKLQTMANLTNIKFFYLLWGGEYTYQDPALHQQSQQFQVADITFWDNNNTIILSSAPLTKLIMAQVATLHVTNQKNGVRGQVIHNAAIHSAACPVRLLP